MTLEQLEQANRIYEKERKISKCLHCCAGVIDAKQAICVRPLENITFLGTQEIQEFILPQDISEAIMTKAIELLDKRIKELEEEFKQI